MAEVSQIALPSSRSGSCAIHVPAPVDHHVACRYIKVAIQMELKASDVVQTRSPPVSSPLTSAHTFPEHLHTKFPELFPDNLLDQNFECLQLPEVRLALVRYLYTHLYNYLDDELVEVAPVLDEIITSSPPRDELVARRQQIVPGIAMARVIVDRLLDSRDTDGLDSGQYDQTLTSVLAQLYKLVGKPVIE
jgi:hypothetical protein